MKKSLIIRLAVALSIAGLMAACTFFPHVDLGVDFNYHGGKFHVSPNASIGVTGRP